MSIESKGNTVKETRGLETNRVTTQAGSSYGGSLHRGITSGSLDGTDFLTLMEKHWQKAAACFLVLLACIWFFREYQTTMELKNEEASQSFEKASRLLASIMSGEAASPDLKNVPQTELIERYLDEVNRLRTDYNQSNFAELAKALDSAYAVSRISFMESAAVDMDKLKEAIAGIHNNSFAKEPVKRISSELQTLLLSRYLLASNIADTVETGRNNLRLLVEKGEIFPVEAAVSYLLSYDRSSEEYRKAFALFDQLIKRLPDMEQALVDECTRLGISYTPTSADSVG